MKNSKLRVLLECAILIALGTVLAQIKIYRLPNGGSVTAFSMVPFIIISFRHGTKWGVLSGFVNAFLQMILGGVYMPPAGSIVSLAGSVLLDYVLAYVSLGFADIFAKPFRVYHKKFAYIFGAFMACSLRFICAFLSGFIIWGDLSGGVVPALIFSIGYNASYLLPETIITCLGIGLLNRYMVKLYG